jgi:hypothetical protein
MLKWYLLGSLLLTGALVSVITVCHGRSIQLNELQQRQAEWIIERSALNQELTKRNERIKAMNARQLQVIAEAERQIQAAHEEAEQVRQQRDEITAALSTSRREWAEAMQHDPTLADFVAHPVPAAVWRRLCSATANC